jgi:hypothetical protein
MGVNVLSVGPELALEEPPEQPAATATRSR